MYVNHSVIPKPNAPCRYCEDRHMGCHAECSKYQEWNAKRQEVLAAKEKEHQVNDGIVQLNYNTRIQTRARQHKPRKRR